MIATKRSYTEGQISSDAGLLAFRQFDARWDFSRRMADCLNVGDAACLSKLRQRLFGIIAGYEDCNDHDTLRGDPVLKMIAGRLPDDGPLASSPRRCCRP